MIEENLDEDVLYVLHQLVEQIDEDFELDACVHICDDCSVVNSSVRRQIRPEKETTTDSNIALYLCDSCAQKRHDDAQQVLQDLEHLAHEVEQRLQAIENTERELDQWRDAQLQKNRDFWDGIVNSYFSKHTIKYTLLLMYFVLEYRRQVENFSACRIRTLQYEYTMRQLKTQRIMKRLKRAKYIAENIEQLREQLYDLIQPSLIDLLASDQFRSQFSTLSSADDENENSITTSEDRRELLQQLEELSCLDKVLLPGDDVSVDDEINDEIDE